MQYILGIDQSTQGTKAILTDEDGKIVGRADRSHRQIINDLGWVSHDLEEIYQNVLSAVREVTGQTKISGDHIKAVGISNQRETTAIWSRDGKPLSHAVVWQCSRAKEIAREVKEKAGFIQERTGLHLSPYFPASKMAWLLRNTEAVSNACLGTMDSWLLYRLTEGRSFKTDYSNASRTQLFHIRELKWDEEICSMFQIPPDMLPEICDSNSMFGMTDFDGFLSRKIPIYSVLGDSHAALYGQGCHRPGMVKATYGTGSSVMMNTGENCAASTHGLVTSLAWGIDGKVSYVLEGNINYTGAVISWLKDEMELITSPNETETAAKAANPKDRTVLIPAFSGLSAPYWEDHVKAMLYGMTRTTGKNEVIRAALESIAQQIQAVIEAMEKDSGLKIGELRADGGPTRNAWLMQMQSDLSDTVVAVSETEALSALGAAYLAGMGAGMYDKEKLFSMDNRRFFYPSMPQKQREEKRKNWRQAVRLVSVGAENTEGAGDGKDKEEV